MCVCVLHLQTVDKLREHLNRYLPQLGKKKIDALVVNYVAKLVDALCMFLVYACVCECVCEMARAKVVLN